MKKKLAMMILMSLVVAVGMPGINAGDFFIGHDKINVVKAENEEQTETLDETNAKRNKKKQIKLLDELNAAKKKTLTAPKLEVNIEVGQYGTYPIIRRDACIDNENQVIHIVDTAYDNVKKPWTYMELWLDTANKYKYKYDKTRKQYILKINDAGKKDLDYLDNEIYLNKTKKSFLDRKENCVKKKGKEKIKVNGKKIKCKKLVLRKEYMVPKQFQSEVNKSNENSSIEMVSLKIDFTYYIGIDDGNIYKINHKVTKDGKVNASKDIMYNYPKKNLKIPKKYTENATLVDEIRFTRKGIIYETEYLGDKTVLSIYLTSKKIRDKKKIVIPKYVKVANKKYQVRRITKMAFAKMKNLKKVVINADVRKIEEAAFNDSYKLKTVIIKTEKLKHVEHFPFVSWYTTFKVPKNKIKAYKKLFKKAGMEKFKVEELDVE